jgi:dCMP deaminase
MNGRDRLDWPETAMRLAFEIARCRSEDPFVQVGACAITKSHSIILGYNGAPSGQEVNWEDRDGRRPFMIHAESNVLDSARIGEIKLLAVTHLPCEECIKRVAQHQIKEVHYCHGEELWKGKNTYDFAAVRRMATVLEIKLNRIKLNPSL